MGAEAEEGKTGAFVGSGVVRIGKVAEEGKVGGKVVDIGNEGFEEAEFGARVGMEGKGKAVIVLGMEGGMFEFKLSLLEVTASQEGGVC